MNRHMKTPWLRVFLVLAVTALTANSATLLAQAISDTTAQAPLPTVELVVNDVTLIAEVAQNSNQRYMGLSFRSSMPDNAGMLFAYPNERILTFTMRNTLIPLQIAYLSKDMVINEIHEMPVGPDQLFPSKFPAQFALEVNRGWFEQNGVAVGDRITLR